MIRGATTSVVQRSHSSILAREPDQEQYPWRSIFMPWLPLTVVIKQVNPIADLNCTYSYKRGANESVKIALRYSEMNTS